jgi:hypothetical protein
MMKLPVPGRDEARPVKQIAKKPAAALKETLSKYLAEALDD